MSLSNELVITVEMLQLRKNDLLEIEPKNK